MPTYNPSQEQQTDTDLSGPQGGGGTSRLKSILAAVASVGSTAMAGIPDKGRSTVFTGLGEGARAEQAAQANQQAIKFKSFDDQVRAAQLHNQDLELQNHTQEQSDAHQKAQDFQHDWDEDHGLQYDELPNSGQAVMDHLTAQTQGNGAASIPPGTHLSADGKTILIPKQSDDTQAAQLQKYNTFREAYNLPALPQGATFVPNKNLDMLQNRIEGHSISGDVYNHETLPVAIADLQATRDSLAKKSGTNPNVLKMVDSTIGSMQAKQDYLDDHAAGVAQQTAQAKAQGTADVANNPANQTATATGAGLKAGAVAAAQAPFQQQKADNAAANKAKNDTNMYVGTDAAGNQIAGTNTDLASAGAQGITKLDADTGKKVITARQLISPDGLFAKIKQDMLNLDAKGKMGSSATARLNDALLQKAGADPDYAPLFVHTHLLATALMQAHVGSRGSADMMDEFKSLANAGKMNSGTLRSALGAEYNYVKEKAMLPKQPAANTNGGGQ